MQKKLILIICILINHSIVIAGIGDWTTFTNKSDIRDIGIYKNFIWCATNGGVFKYNMIDSTYEEFTNTNGLASIDVKTLDIDANGNVWFGTNDGYLFFYQSDTQAWKIIDDYYGNVIYDLKLYGDSLFVVLKIGISLYHLPRQEVKETYKNLGKNFNFFNVNTVHLNGRDIWAGTDIGIAKSNLNLANLLAPESWVNYTRSNANIVGNKIRSIAALDGTIFVATDGGISAYDGAAWKTVNDGLASTDVYALAEKNGILYAGTLTGAYQLIENHWHMLGAPFWNITSLAVAENGELWAGRAKSSQSNGFSHFSQVDQVWHHFVPPGPGDNNFKALAIDHDGVLWCGSTNEASESIFSYDGEKWKIYKKAEGGYRYNNFWGVKVDRFNQKWFASWGSGVIKIDAKDKVTVYNQELKPGGGYIAVTNVVIDHSDNVWFTIYAAADGNVVAATTTDTTINESERRWQFFSTDDGIITNMGKELYGIGVDRFNRIWVGTRSGVTVIDYNNTLFDKSDDDLSGTLTTSDGLIDNDVRSIIEDYDGIMWLGTNQGINYWQGGEVFDKGGVVHDNIQTIVVDVRNNKWFGTIGGVGVLASDNYTWTEYTTKNCPLVSSSVTAIALDELTGRVYIGTTNGLSCLQTPYVKPQPNLSQVTAGPNPFILKNSTYFNIYKLTDNVSIKFFTTNGMLVRDVPKDLIQGLYEWDGKDNSGELVASGIYLYLIYDEVTGASHLGKVAVIK